MYFIIQITVTSDRHTIWTKELTSDDAKVGRALASGHLPSLAKAVMKHEALSELIVSHITKKVDNECNSLCQRSVPSIFRKVPVSQMTEFKWELCVEELKKSAPLMFQILSTITSKNDTRNKSKRGSAHYPGLCFACSVLLKERNREMCGIQSIVSLFLMVSGVEKKVNIA